ncbi:integral membrane protein TIGR01906 [Pseudarthrobacter chlorophenolicus A6]|uniref:Integral membrane protein TIGR01906 n=1 Tax=Pseudarthrobacter chlorophenolicus (strain ATCC 700700 / DSM 12829 / CIP 107037 / JCM 12360 / KCTC 9906 / NCIMB 13794 / A6) TaxID=452863 RepID=B8HEZ8_PSECP|nr:TIGR01906 family membrane protein [Pseudarthrobacter chlorophenolicus]ACL39264.1 integral membrane protein TIGR01906 [Pseudarthrobacter chlorophenolicus A6]SDR01983.1 integral membrane protein TIGR01906 [Pseudarthrobacter chlorophenolicus]
MKDETPARAKNAQPQPEPFLDTSGDSDEPAFSWMAAGNGDTAKDTTARERSVNGGTGKETPAPERTAEGAAKETPTPSRTSEGEATEGAAAPVGQQPDSRSGRRAAEAADEPAAQKSAAVQSNAAGTSAAGSSAAAQSATAQPATGKPSGKGDGAAFREPLPTSALSVRPPEEEVERRNAERESAANAKPVAPRVMQVLLAIFFPVVLLVLAVRAVTSPLFLWIEYNRPGFPGDGYGFSTDDRMTYGSYAVDYLSNWAGPRYLGDLVHRSGDKLFKDGEVSHMADVKTVILSTFGAGTLLLVLGVIAALYLRKRSAGGVRRGLFAGSIVTLVLILGLGTLAFLGWQQFFTEFHRIFFADGSWTFSLDDTLIRLFPGQFWMDAGIVIGGLVLLVSLVTLILTWPTRRRRGVARTAEETTEPAQA